MTRIVFLLALFMAPLAACAQTVMTLSECLDSAFAANPALRRARLAEHRARIMQGTAFDVEKTDVVLGQTPLPGDGTDNALSFGQDFDFPTVYIARHKALKAGTRLEASRLALQTARLRYDVVTAYSALVKATADVVIYQMQDTLLEHYYQTARRRLEAGECSRLEMLSAFNAHRDNHGELSRARAALTAAQLQLRALVNGKDAVAPSPAEFGTLLPEPQLVPADFANTLGGRVARAQIALSERNLALERQQFLPGISLGAKTQLLLKGFNPYNVDRYRFDGGNFLLFEVGLKVPLFFGAQRARTRAAAREVEMARLDAREAELAHDAELGAARADFEAAAENLRMFTESGGYAARMEQLATVSYNLSEISYYEYVQTLQEVGAIRLSHARAVDDYNRAAARLHFLLATE